MSLSRRALLGSAMGTAAAATLGVTPPPTQAAAGILLDFAGGIPSPAAIRAAGAIGTIRYVSDPRSPGLRAKPLTRPQVESSKAAGLLLVSCYQYGKNATADWRGGQTAGYQHAQRGVALHLAAGGPPGAPIYAAIDDNPTDAELQGPIFSYLRGWQQVVGANAVGVYGNPRTIEFCIRTGVARWYWQHDYGNPGYATHPSAHLHQRAASMQRQPVVDGITCDINDIKRVSFGSW